MGTPVEISSSEMRNFPVRRLSKRSCWMGYIDGEVQKQVTHRQITYEQKLFSGEMSSKMY
jgi:hypothetical protein